jgi:uncharacterized protein involved in exopolysaccharide biosynthesis
VSSEESISTPAQPAGSPNWVANTALLWAHRRTLARVAAVALVLSAVIAFFVMQKEYQSEARLMPPDQGSSGAALLAAVAGRSLGGLGSLAGLLGGKTSSALFIDLLRSRTVGDQIIDRFNLMHVYHQRYRIDAEKRLTRHTEIMEDKKSGVISITYTDTDRELARAITQAYLDGLNKVVMTSNTSSARHEREFIEKRLVSVQADLQDAEKALSQFSSVNTTLDIKEQTRAMVDAAAKLQGELIASQSELDSLQQIYGNENVRIRASRARIAELQHELTKMSGSSAALPAGISTNSGGDSTELYPSLRQLPRLAVPYTDLYRRVRIQETVFEMLSQQYETSRIEEAKDTPVVSVIDPPVVAEKKSFPPRLLVVFLLTSFSVAAAAVLLLIQHRLGQIGSDDPRSLLAQHIGASLPTRFRRFIPLWRDSQ